MTNDTVSFQKRLPDLEICRTRYLGQCVNLWHCLMDTPDNCKFAVRIGFGVICRHPIRRGFEKTEKAV